MGRRKKVKEPTISEALDEIKEMSKRLDKSIIILEKFSGEFSLLTHLAYALKLDLEKMDEVGAIDLDEWPVADRLVKVLNKDDGLKFLKDYLSMDYIELLRKGLV